jgi:hypothetical protein
MSGFLIIQTLEVVAIIIQFSSLFLCAASTAKRPITETSHNNDNNNNNFLLLVWRIGFQFKLKPRYQRHGLGQMRHQYWKLESHPIHG